MSNLVANLVSKLSFRLRPQFFSFLGKKRSPAILCVKRRDHSSTSFPIRYIPKKTSSKVDEHQKTNPTDSSEDRVLGKSVGGLRTKVLVDEEVKFRNKTNGCSGLLDNEQGFEANINHDTKLIKCKPVKDTCMAAEDEKNQHKKLIFNEEVAKEAMLDAQRMAIGFLAKRAFTAVELTKKLYAKKVRPNIVGALITDFQSRGLINDSLYAETFSESRWSSSSWGPRRIKQALFKKGISEVDAEKAVKSVFEDVQSGGEISKLGMSKVSMDHLLVQTTKQWFRSVNVPTETRKSRIIRWLQYRGFNWGVISYILRKLESQNSS